MKIPNSYDRNAAESTGRLTPGGHKCIIKQVEETTSKSGKAMLIISFDTSMEDPQPEFYLKRWQNDTRDEKKWQGNSYLVLEGEYAEANLNRFLSAVDHSNEGFNPAKGGELDPKVFKNLKVGVVFREEEYEPQTATMTDLMNGVYPTAVRPFRFCDYYKALDQEAPKKKTINKVQTATVTPSTAGFIDVPADALEDEGLPFK